MSKKKTILNSGEYLYIMFSVAVVFVNFFYNDLTLFKVFNDLLSEKDSKTNKRAIYLSILSYVLENVAYILIITNTTFKIVIHVQ